MSSTIEIYTEVPGIAWEITYDGTVYILRQDGGIWRCDSADKLVWSGRRENEFAAVKDSLDAIKARGLAGREK